MAYEATVVPIMIASPGDVSEERDTIRKVIHDWNDINAAQSKIVLIPVGWETHSSPDLCGRPQELINSRLLKDCDILIGVFWTRFGTPTGEAQSGTEEEIETHISHGKPAMLYFSSKPVAPESIDTEQYKKVQDFKQKCYNKGLVESFDSTIDFENKLRSQLHIIFSQNPYLKDLVAKPKPENINSLPLPFESPLYLSDEAKELLRAASSHDGTILKIATLGGRFIQVGGGKSYGGESGRDNAKWEAALNDLVFEGLMVERGYKGTVFELTHKGWEIADSLNV